MSERVLHEWTTESGRRLSILDESDAFGKGEVGIGVDGEIDSSLGWGLALARELARLAARVAELDAMYETSHASRLHAENCVRRLETENAKLKEGLDRLVRIYNERTDEVNKVREERNEAEYEAVELRAENANLLAALLDLYNAHQNKKLEAAMRSTGRWTQIKGMVGDANDEAFRALGVEVDK